jgi:hypothetical protein
MLACVTSWFIQLSTDCKAALPTKLAFKRLLTLAQEALHPMHVIVIDCLMPLSRVI